MGISAFPKLGKFQGKTLQGLKLGIAASQGPPEGIKTGNSLPKKLQKMGKLSQFSTGINIPDPNPSIPKFLRWAWPSGIPNIQKNPNWDPGNLGASGSSPGNSSPGLRLENPRIWEFWGMIFRWFLHFQQLQGFSLIPRNSRMKTPNHQSQKIPGIPRSFGVDQEI